MNEFNLQDRKFNVDISAVQQDHRCDRITFVFPKILNKEDITGEDYRIWVKWINKNFQGNSDECEKVVDAENVKATWILTNTVTQIHGPIHFSVEIIKSHSKDEEIIVDFSWNSEIETIEIKNTLETLDDVKEGNKDYIDHQIQQYIEQAGDTFKGPQGEVGPQGPQGPRGEIGPQGPAGINGVGRLDSTSGEIFNIYTGGEKNIANGQYSHAEGSLAKAYGHSSHAEGRSSTAQGSNSHAEGHGTYANSSGGHTEGYRTFVDGNYSHAEGWSSYQFNNFITPDEDFKKEKSETDPTRIYDKDKIVNKFSTNKFVGTFSDGAHSEGYNTISLGVGDHSEGYNTIAYGNYGAHAEGCGTRAYGNYTHAEGIYAIAKGQASHAEGQQGMAYGNYAHAEGISSQNLNGLSDEEINNKINTWEETKNFLVAYGNHSHAEGGNTLAKGTYSHTEGYKTFANGNGSHAEGNNTCANVQYSHAEGNGTTANDACSHAEGYNTKANGPYSHAEGYGTIASRQSSHAEGAFNIEDINKKYLHIAGNGISSTNRSNAHTLDWSGNGWFAGKVTTGKNQNERDYQFDDNEFITKIHLNNYIANYIENNINNYITNYIENNIEKILEDYTGRKGLSFNESGYLFAREIPSGSYNLLNAGYLLGGAHFIKTFSFVDSDAFHCTINEEDGTVTLSININGITYSGKLYYLATSMTLRYRNKKYNATIDWEKTELTLEGNTYTFNYSINQTFDPNGELKLDKGAILYIDQESEFISIITSYGSLFSYDLDSSFSECFYLDKKTADTYYKPK